MDLEDTLGSGPKYCPQENSIKYQNKDNTISRFKYVLLMKWCLMKNSRGESHKEMLLSCRKGVIRTL